MNNIMDDVTKYSKCFIPKTWRNKNNIKCHFVSLITDYHITDNKGNPTNIIVYCLWGKYKKCWRYECEERWLFGYGQHLKREKRKREKNTIK